MDLSKIFVHKAADPADVPLEFVRHALGYLEAAEKLNADITNGHWPGSYYRGQPVLWLAFHASELFLKAFILKLDPQANPNGHSLVELLGQLKGLLPHAQFNPLFVVEAMPPYPELVEEAKKKNRVFHAVLRYPTDKRGEPWPGARGYSPGLFETGLARLRTEAETIYQQLFERADA